MTMAQELNHLALVCQPFSDRNRALVGVITRIQESLDLQTIFSTTVAEVRQILQADRVFICRSAEGLGLGTLMALDSKPDLGDFSLSVGEYWQEYQGCLKELRAELYTCDCSYVIEDTTTHQISDRYRQLLYQAHIKAQVLVPLFKGKNPWGILGVHQCTESRQWNFLDTEFIHQIAQHLGLAIQHNSYLEHLKKQRTQLAQILQQKRLAERQKTLASTIHKIRQSLDIEIIFQTTTQETRQLLQVDRVAVYQFNGDWSGQFVAESLAQGWHPVVGQVPMPGSHVLQAQQGGIFRRHQVWSIEDLNHWSHRADYQAEIQQMQVRSCAIAPIFQMDRLWGLLVVCENLQPRSWQRIDLDFLRQIGDQLGVALQQAELLEQTRRQTAEITHAFQQLQQTQMHLIQSEKMASLGQLVAGIAHEINNPVNFIYGNLTYVSNYTLDLIELVRLYQNYFPQVDPTVQAYREAIELDYIVEDLPKTLSSMKTGADRIRQLVNSLHAFSRLDRSDKHPIDIHEGLEGALVILQHRIKPLNDRPAIDVVRNYQPLPPIDCYAAQLNQVFFNIIANALDALEDALHQGHFTHEATRTREGAEEPWASPAPGTFPRPTLSISTAIVTAKPKADLAPPPPPEPNPEPELPGENLPPAPQPKATVMITIGDNGLGIPDSIQPHIFNPFYTTKPPGRGTGLGLSISYQIVVDRHQGNLRCDSAPGQGTTFHIEIPIY
jgi:two-component system, NtrC family, sensor kinase